MSVHPDEPILVVGHAIDLPTLHPGQADDSVGLEVFAGCDRQAPLLELADMRSGSDRDSPIRQQLGELGADLLSKNLKRGFFGGHDGQFGCIDLRFPHLGLRKKRQLVDREAPAVGAGKSENHPLRAAILHSADDALNVCLVHEAPEGRHPWQRPQESRSARHHEVVVGNLLFVVADRPLCTGLYRGDAFEPET